MKPVSLTSPALAGGFFTTSPTWEAPPPLPFPLCKSILFPLLAGQGLSLGPLWLQTPNCNSLLILNVFAGEITGCLFFYLRSTRFLLCRNISVSFSYFHSFLFSIPPHCLSLYASTSVSVWIPFNLIYLLCLLLFVCSLLSPLSACLCLYLSSLHQDASICLSLISTPPPCLAFFVSGCLCLSLKQGYMIMSSTTFLLSQ